MTTETEETAQVSADRPAHIRIARALAALMTVICLLWNLDIQSHFGLALIEETFQAFVLGLGLGVLYLTVSIRRTKQDKLPWYDALLAVISLGVLTYASAEFLRLKESGYANSTPEVIGLGAVIMALVIEGLRRSTGYVLLCVVGVFIVYAPLAHLVPGQLVGLEVPLWQLAMNMGFNPNALFGLPLQVSTTIVIMFILMGQVLFKAGGGQFFTDFAMAAMGRRRGGSAKIAVIGSALFGTISGSAVSNVVTTGIITIPLMRRAGYGATHAGAIEAIASTGGQLMPPVMGAAAFLMAEFLEMPYAEICIAAAIPAVLYYFAVFVQVDLIAARDGISVVDQDLPKIGDVLMNGWHLIVPFVVLIYALFELNMPPAKAAIYSTAIIVVAGLLKSYKGERLRLGDLYGVMADTGTVVVELLMIVGAAGFVIGVLNLTGLGLALPNTIVDFAGSNLFVLLGIAAVICIILGMGMPTTAVYILLATLVAPAIIAAGVDPVPAHLFILYFGMMSMITPPIALSAFAAATLTKADPMATGFVAMRMGWVAYVVPFLFVLSPTLLLMGGTWPTAISVVTAMIGVYVVSIAVVGFFVRPLGWPSRAILAVAGFASMVPGAAFGLAGIIEAPGIVISAALLGREYLVARRLAYAQK